GSPRGGRGGAPGVAGRGSRLPLRRPPRKLQGTRRRGGGAGCAARGWTAGPELGLGHRRRRPRGGGPAPPACARNGAARPFRGTRPGLAPPCALRARGPLRPSHALRMLEPGHAGGHGSWPRRRGHAGGRDPGQGAGWRHRSSRRARRPGRPRVGARWSRAGPPAARGHGWRRPPARAGSVRLERPHRSHARPLRRPVPAGSRMTRDRVSLLAAVALALGLALVVITGRPKGALTAGLLAAGTVSAFVIRARARPPAGTKARTQGVLVALLLVSVVQFHAVGGRIAGDGVSYYVYVRSLMKDADLDFTDEYTHYEMIDRDDLKVPTRTGRRRSIFSVGPGLAWIPFFAAGEIVGRAQRALGAEVDLSGYGPVHVNAVALGSLLYGFAAVLLMHGLLRRHFPEDTALLAAVLAWWATFLHWYMVHQPTMSHAVSAAGAALVVWLWDRQRSRPTFGSAAGLGLATGFAMCLRWQNALLLLLPAWDALLAIRRGGREAAEGLRRTVLVGAAVLVGAFPQMAAWKAIYGDWLLRHPPHGADFLRLDHPYVLQTLFSSRHGLLSWTPIFWAGYL